MHIVTIPYYDNESDIVRSDGFFFEEPPTLLDALKRFYISEKRSYIDEDYETHTIEELLEIAVEDYKISSIPVLILEPSGKRKTSVWQVEEAYLQTRREKVLRNYLNSQSEIVLSTHALYDREMRWDDIHFSFNGEERFLFSFCAKGFEEGDKTREEEDFAHVSLETGIPESFADFLEIESPIASEQEIVSVFRLWAQKAGIEIEGKTVRMASESDFQRRPFIEGLLEQDEQDPNRIFVTPSHLMFTFLRSEIPPLPELIETLKKEKPGTVACAIDEFKDSTLLEILDGLGEPLKSQVIELLPQIPCLSYKERKRFANLFSYSAGFIAERMEKLRPRFESASQKPSHLLTDYDNDVLAEYKVWKEALQTEKTAESQ